MLDADYAVHPDWLKDLVPAFADPAVGLVQAPQDHRDASRRVTQVAMRHASVTSTMIYAHVSERDVETAVDRAF